MGAARHPHPRLDRTQGRDEHPPPGPQRCPRDPLGRFRREERRCPYHPRSSQGPRRSWTRTAPAPSRGTPGTRSGSATSCGGWRSRSSRAGRISKTRRGGRRSRSRDSGTARQPTVGPCTGTTGAGNGACTRGWSRNVTSRVCLRKSRPTRRGSSGADGPHECPPAPTRQRLRASRIPPRPSGLGNPP